MIFIAIVVGCILGAVIGIYAPMVPYTYSGYLAIAIIAALDSVFGGISSTLNKTFDIKIFVDNNLVSQRTSGVGNYYYNNNTLPLGTHSIRIAVSSEDGESMSLDFVVNIVAGDYIRRTIVTGGLIANWDASGLSETGS